MAIFCLATKKIPTAAGSRAIRSTLARSIATQATNSGDGKSKRRGNEMPLLASLLGLTLTTAGSITLLDSRKGSHYEQPKGIQPNTESPPKILKPNRINQPPSRPDLPIYTIDEVAEHADPDSLWYTFRGGVYDLTSFYQGHPGGAPVSTLKYTKKKLWIY